MSGDNGGMYWTEDRWREWAGYADDVRVQVKFVSDLMQEDPDEVWSFEFGPEGDWDREWLERNLAELATADEASCCGHGNYTLDSRARRTEWGASGAVQEFTLAVSSGILSTALWQAFLFIANRMSEGRGVSTVATAEDAMELSKYRVLLHLGTVSYDDLEPVKAVEERGVWTVEVLLRPTGDKFTVETSTSSSGCPVSRLTKRELGLLNPDGQHQH